MFVTKAHLSRRAVLRGAGVTLGLPLLDSMIPTQTPRRKTPAVCKTRFAAIEMVHGAAGSTPLGRAKNYWSPAQAGANFEFTPSLKPLEIFRDYITVISNTELHNAMSLVPEEDGPMADHARSSAVFLTAAHPRRSDIEIQSGPSVDQLYADTVGHETPIRSLQLCIENNTAEGVCGHGYSCDYSNTISWASPGKPLKMEVSPRAVFDRLFKRPGGGPSPSVLDPASSSAASLTSRLGVADRRRVNEYLEAIRDVERRIQEIEQDPASGRTGPWPSAPLSVPDDFDVHVKLMFDLQALAFTANLTCVSALKMGIDRSQRLYPGSGVPTPFHTLSHHRETPEGIEEFARLNRYHVSKVAYFLDRLRSVEDGDGNLLDHAVILYGSPMGDSHIHEHRFLPLFLAGHANGALRGNRHLKCPEDTPLANVLLTLAQKLDLPIERIGDSAGLVDI